jgi:cytochrome c-type biogenesis protein CcmH/NrfF
LPKRRAQWALVVLLLGGGLALRGDTGWTARAQRLGQQLICTCGCTQGVMVCNHVGCPVVTQMRAEVQQRAASKDSDSLILESFVQEYGTQVLANPTKTGFNLLAWVLPWVALGLGLALVLYVVQRWHQRQAPAAAPPADVSDSIRAEIESAIEEEWR